MGCWSSERQCKNRYTCTCVHCLKYVHSYVSIELSSYVASYIAIVNCLTTDGPMDVYTQMKHGRPYMAATDGLSLPQVLCPFSILYMKWMVWKQIIAMWFYLTVYSNKSISNLCTHSGRNHTSSYRVARLYTWDICVQFHMI